MNKVLNIVFGICVTILIQPKLYGQNWIDISPHFDYPDSSRYHYDGCFINVNEGWFKKSFPGTLWHTIDGGTTWEKQIDSNDSWFHNIQFIDEFHGWITGKTYIRPGYEYFILITKDGGKSWAKYSNPSLGCIAFTDSLNGFAGGSSIYSTIDGGITWYPQKVDSGVSFGITDIYFIDKNNGWAVGGSGSAVDAGIILNTTNGGKYWNINRHPTSIYGRSVYFTDSLHGCIVGVKAGYSGMKAVTNDGGLNWKIDYPPSWLNDVVFINDSIGWIVGNFGYILNTTDRGVTWTQIESSTTSDLENIFFFYNGEVGYILGRSSTLLKYDKTVGIKDQSQSVVSSFKLFQNYPNPFNPTTVISYQLAVNSKVQLKIYDMLGKEVATLVNKEQSAGYYTVNFNASSVSRQIASGTYIYRIEAGDPSTGSGQGFVQTRKMLLLK